MQQTIDAGFMPQSMLYQDDSNGQAQSCWKRFHRVWARPAIIAARMAFNPARPDDPAQLILDAAGSG